jgi:hypothetical protein
MTAAWGMMLQVISQESTGWMGLIQNLVDQVGTQFTKRS